MARQIGVDDIILSEINKNVQRIIAEEYSRRDEDGQLPCVRSSQEAYGQLIECFGGVEASMRALKSHMGDALGMVSQSAGIIEPAQDIHSASIDIATAAIHTAVIAQNIAFTLAQSVPIPDAPLIDALEDGAMDGSADSVDDMNI